MNSRLQFLLRQNHGRVLKKKLIQYLDTLHRSQPYEAQFANLITSDQWFQVAWRLVVSGYPSKSRLLTNSRIELLEFINQDSEVKVSVHAISHYAECGCFSCSTSLSPIDLAEFDKDTWLGSSSTGDRLWYLDLYDEDDVLWYDWRLYDLSLSEERLPELVFEDLKWPRVSG
jgi:hypothetical protein